MLNKEKNSVDLLAAPGLLLGNAVVATTALSATLVTVLEHSDKVADALGMAAVYHAQIVQDSAEAKRMIAQYEHKTLLDEIKSKYEDKGATKK